MKKTLLAFGCLLLAVTVGRPSSLPLALVTPGAKEPDAGHWGVAVRLTMITDLAIARLFASRIPSGELDRQQSDRTVRATGQAPVPPVERPTVAAGPATGVPSRAPARLPAARPTEPLEPVRFARGGSVDLWSVLHRDLVQPAPAGRLADLDGFVGDLRREVILQWKGDSKKSALRRPANCEVAAAN